MALASFHVDIISHRTGRSAVAAAAYRAADKLHNTYDGRTSDYTRRKGVIYAEIMAPQNAPEFVYNREALWNESQKAQLKKDGTLRDDAQLAREAVVSLQRELTKEQNIALEKEIGQIFVDQGMVVDFAVHDKGDGNPHAHYLLTMRNITEDGLSKKKNGDWDKNDCVLSWRKSYQDITNRYLEMNEFEERICVDSYEKQGIDKIPTIHLGHYAHHLEQMGIESERGNINRGIQKDNQEKKEINREIEMLKNKLEQEREHAETWHDKIEHYRKVSEEVQHTANVLEHRLTQRGVSYLVQQQKNAETVLKRHKLPELPVEEPPPQNLPTLPEGQQSSELPKDSGHHSRFSSLRRKSDQEPEQEQVGRAPPPLPHRHPEGWTFAQLRQFHQEHVKNRYEAKKEHPPPLHRHQESRRFAKQQEQKGERDQAPEKPPDHAPPGRAHMRRMILAKEEEHHNRPSLSREERRLRFQQELAELRKEHVEHQAQERNRDSRKREK